MKTLLLILSFILIILIDIPSIIKKGSDKEKYFAVYSLILLAGFAISLLQLIDMAPASPAKLIESIIRSFIGET